MCFTADIVEQLTTLSELPQHTRFIMATQTITHGKTILNTGDLLPESAPKNSALVRREDSAQGSVLHLIPQYTTLEELLLREKRHMAAAFRVFAKLGYADGASGHISLRGIIRS